ncbi:MAG: hypothetical protein WBB23_16350 [Desulforhopalus sp.]
MKYFTKQPLLKNIYKSAKSLKGPGTSPVSTLATMASLGLSLSYLLSNRNKLVGSGKKEVEKQKPNQLNDQPPTTENTYYEAAPRAISGSHRNIGESHTGNGAMMKKSGQVALGSAALLSIMYLVRKRK